MNDRVEMPLCETKGLGKDFLLPSGQKFRVLDKVDVQVYPNEILAIVGPSGCGKSTFIRILAGLIAPNEGEVLYHGKKITGLLPNFSLVFQNFALYPWMTVYQNIEMVLKTMGLSQKEIHKRASDAIAMIGLTGFEEAFPREISGGMKQRVGLARALVRRPEILLLDEPFSALDTFTAEVLRGELLDIWENKRNQLSSIVLISHDIREVAFLADRIIMMEANPGRIRFIKKNTLPRPRDDRSDAFNHLVNELHDAYPQGERIPLPHVTVDEVLGLLTYLNRYGESKEVHKIGGFGVDHYDRALRGVGAAVLLKFIKRENRIVTLTELGKKYLSSDAKHRRLIWKEQLVTIPLFGKAIQWLQLASKHSLSRKEFIDLIAKELPHQNAQEQWKILAGWGSYAELFVHHRKTHIVSLKTS